MKTLFRGLLAAVVALSIPSCGPAFARDGYQNRPSVCDTATGLRAERCHAWVSSVLRPDTRTSCCGDGDAYIADDFEVVGDQLFAIISIEYPAPEPDGITLDDGTTPVSTFTVHKGQKILIPPEKIGHALEDANRSSHGVVFLIPGTITVLCYFAPPLV